MAERTARQKWSRNDNLDVARCYFRATAAGRAGYIARLHHEWETLRPDRPVSSQRLADQWRLILRNKYFAEAELEELRNRVVGVEDDDADPRDDNDPRGDDDRDRVPVRLDNADPVEEPEAAIASDASEPDLETSSSTVDNAEHRAVRLLTEVVDAAMREPDGEPPIPTFPDGTPVTGKDAALFMNIVNAFRKYSVTPLEERPKLPALASTPSRILNNTVHNANKLIPVLLLQLPNQQPLTLTDINNIVFSIAAAVTTTIHSSTSLPTETETSHRPSQHLDRMKKKVKHLRADVSRLTSFVRRLDPGKLACSISGSRVADRYRLSSAQQAVDLLELRKMELLATAARVRRYEQQRKRKYHNNLFDRNEHAFYRHLEKTTTNSAASPATEDLDEFPSQAAIEQFWRDLYEQPAALGRGGWFDRFSAASESIDEQEEVVITEEILQQQLRKLSNWKSPGRDRIHAFWWKRLTSLRSKILQCFSGLLDGSEPLPPWLCFGMTTLIYKNGDRKLPQNYRPITCLPTITKLFTSALCCVMWDHINSNDLLPVEQVGCTRGRGGCQEQLLIDAMIMDDAHSRKKNLAVAWLDVKKAYDSISHEWVGELVRLLGFNPSICQCLHRLINTWRTQFRIPGPSPQSVSQPISILRGIFQGDSLSPLLFCLSLLPISRELRHSGFGYLNGPPAHRTLVSHLYYMDDLKLFASSVAKLESMTSVAEIVGRDIGLDLNPGKCSIFSLHRGQPVADAPDVTTLASESIIAHLDDNASYKYLGLTERGQFCSPTIKASIRQEYHRRLRMILQSGLSAKRLIKAINAYAVPVILYSLPLLHWTKEEIASLDRLTRRLLTEFRAHHPHASTIRIYLPRSSGGRGLLSVEQMLCRSVVRLARYLVSYQAESYLLAAVHFHQVHLAPSKSLIHRASAFLDSLGIPLEQASKVKVKQAIHGSAQQQLQQRPLQGQFWKRLVAADGIDLNLSLAWLKSPSLRPETEGFLIAAQEQMLDTRNFRAHILHSIPLSEDCCRMCGNRGETVDHILNYCPVLARKAYVDRHDSVVKLLHWAICAHHQAPGLSSIARHQLVHTVQLSGGHTVLWEVSVPTDKRLLANRPDLILRGADTAIVIDVAVPMEQNLAAKAKEKSEKYKPLCAELKNVWNLVAVPEVVPIVVGSRGGLMFDIGGCLKKLCGTRLRPQALQRQAILGSLSILRSVLQ